MPKSDSCQFGSPDPNGSSHEDRSQFFTASTFESSTQFNYDEIDRALGHERQDPIETAIELFSATLRCMIIDIETAGPNAAREATYHRIAIGIRDDDDESMRSIATKWGISPEAVSKRVETIRKRHCLPLNGFNKPQAVADKYRESNSTKRRLHP